MGLTGLRGAYETKEVVTNERNSRVRVGVNTAELLCTYSMYVFRVASLTLDILYSCSMKSTYVFSGRFRLLAVHLHPHDSEGCCLFGRGHGYRTLPCTLLTGARRATAPSVPPTDPTYQRNHCPATAGSEVSAACTCACCAKQRRLRPSRLVCAG